GDSGANGAGPVAGLARSANRTEADARLVADLSPLLRQASADVAATYGVAPGAATVAVRDSAAAPIWAGAREAVTAAGLTPVAVIGAAEAVCWHLIAGGVPIGPGDLVLVC